MMDPVDEVLRELAVAELAVPLWPAAADPSVPPRLVPEPVPVEAEPVDALDEPAEEESEALALLVASATISFTAWASDSRAADTRDCAAVSESRAAMHVVAPDSEEDSVAGAEGSAEELSAGWAEVLSEGSSVAEGLGWEADAELLADGAWELLDSVEEAELVVGPAGDDDEVVVVAGSVGSQDSDVARSRLLNPAQDWSNSRWACETFCLSRLSSLSCSAFDGAALVADVPVPPLDDAEGPAEERPVEAELAGALAAAEGDPLAEPEVPVDRRTEVDWPPVPAAEELRAVACAPCAGEVPEAEEVADAVALAEALAAVSAWARDSFACARASSAWSTSASREVGSRVARVSPAVTCWPTVTLTLDTVPAAGKLTDALFWAATLPEAVRVWVTEPVVARVVIHLWEAAARRCWSRVSDPPRARMRTAVTMMTARRRRGADCG